jgi:hypothetical protein
LLETVVDIPVGDFVGPIDLVGPGLLAAYLAGRTWGLVDHPPDLAGAGIGENSTAGALTRGRKGSYPTDSPRDRSFDSPFG